MYNSIALLKEGSEGNLGSLTLIKKLIRIIYKKPI